MTKVERAGWVWIVHGLKFKDLCRMILTTCPQKRPFLSYKIGLQKTKHEGRYMIASYCISFSTITNDLATLKTTPL
jgi:hypothetical protein